MKIVNINANPEATSEVPILIDFAEPPHSDLQDGEEVNVYLMDNDGIQFAGPAIRTIIKTHDGEGVRSNWFQAYIPANT